MSRSDFIGDFLTSIRNAARAKKDKLTVPSSSLTVRIAEILKEEGFIENVKPFAEGQKHFARIHLKYVGGGKKPAIQGINRVSKPGIRYYVGCNKIPKVQGGLGISILTTPKGVMTDRQARENKVGGEIICRVW
ncbi:MAG TPA: 30S ribosomal protein S8 [Candidatus Omnitrophota bacterium]|jgi:small subunit ribosomal protein S8|nr:MAG: 30S ribosomal protein S8 [Candidatus Omnitrophica bacterium ADurb.Bin314]HOE68255.1 30S ribosomal protein S8 [Candidatus Omnitrophota bacterium]HQB93805.1 30S ribosomal protein S8 [Candidatus Omnitrophota bacterium]